MNTKRKITRKEAREHIEQLNLSCELVKIINHLLPQLIPMLKKVSDTRNQSYTTYAGPCPADGQNPLICILHQQYEKSK